MKAIVLGGTLEGVRIAGELAAAGHSVTLAIPGITLGEDLCGTLRLYSADPKDDDIIPWQYDAMDAPWFQAVNRLGETPLLMGRCCKALLRFLLSAGVDPLFMSIPVGLTLRGEHVSGVLFANKLGLLHVQAELVVDATMNRTASWSFAGKEPTIPAGSPVSYRIEYFDVNMEDAPRTIPDITLHAGCLKPGHMYAELTRRFDDSVALKRAQALMRTDAIEKARYLAREVPGFEKAYLGGIAALVEAETGLPPEICARGYFTAENFAEAKDSHGTCGGTETCMIAGRILDGSAYHARPMHTDYSAMVYSERFANM